MFCPELQKLLKPIYDLTKKGRGFHWGREQQDSFIENKVQISKTSSIAYAKQDRQISFIL